MIFRDCYSLGKGSVNGDIFYTVITENNFLVKYLKLKVNCNIPLFKKEIKKFLPIVDKNAKYF